VLLVGGASTGIAAHAQLATLRAAMALPSRQKNQTRLNYGAELSCPSV